MPMANEVMSVCRHLVEDVGVKGSILTCQRFEPTPVLRKSRNCTAEFELVSDVLRDHRQWQGNVEVKRIK